MDALEKFHRASESVIIYLLANDDEPIKKHGKILCFARICRQRRMEKIMEKIKQKFIEN